MTPPKPAPRCGACAWLAPAAFHFTAFALVALGDGADFAGMVGIRFEELACDCPQCGSPVALDLGELPSSVDVRPGTRFVVRGAPRAQDPPEGPQGPDGAEG